MDLFADDSKTMKAVKSYINCKITTKGLNKLYKMESNLRNSSMQKVALLCK